MRQACYVLVLLLLAIPAATQARLRQTTAHTPVATPAPAPTNGAPKAIGHYDDWTAATHLEAGQTVCYAFARAASSTPALSGRGDVVLTVTERPGAARDAVAITAGFAYAPNAAVTLEVETVKVSFYTAQRSAFARNGHAVAALFAHGRQAVARSPIPRAGDVTDTFSLRGFGPAYAAILKACPAK